MAVGGTGGDTMGQLALQGWVCPKPPQGCPVAMRDRASQEWHINHPGTWRCWPFLQLERAPKHHLGQFPALSPSLWQHFVPGVWTGMLSRPTCCQCFPFPLCGCTSPVPQKRLCQGGFSPVHTQPGGVCSTNTSPEDAGTFCARFGAELGSARLRSALPAHVWNKKWCLTPKIALSPPAMIGKGCFVPENDDGAASPPLALVSV